MADAEKLAIRRLLSKSVAVAEAVIRPGPPLPRGHPSPSLLSKLYLNVYGLYGSARSSAKSVGQSTSSKLNILKRDKAQPEEAQDGISQDLRTYLSDGRTFSSALAYKWLGVDAGENAGKIGESLAWLGLSKQALLQLQGQSKLSFAARKGKVERAKRKDRLVEELEDIEAYIKGYKHTNDTVGQVEHHHLPDLTIFAGHVPACTVGGCTPLADSWRKVGASAEAIQPASAGFRIKAQFRHRSCWRGTRCAHGRSELTGCCRWR